MRMKWTQTLLLAWRNVIRHWRHSLSTLIAIAGGFTAICLFDGFMEGIKQQSLESFSVRFMMGDIIIERPETQFHLTDGDFSYTLSKEEQAFLEDFFQQDPDFLMRSRFLGVLGMADNGSTHAIFYGSGYDLVDGTKMRGPIWDWNTLAGKPLHLSNPFSALLGQGLGERLGCEMENPKPELHPEGGYAHEDRPFRCQSNRLQISATTESGQINAFDVEVAGIIDVSIRELDSKYISFSLETAQRLLNTDRILRTTVKLKDPSKLGPFTSRLREKARERGFDFDIIPVMEHQVSKTTRDGLRLISLFRGLFMTIVILISILSIANTMMKAVTERTREIGTLRSLGLLPNEIRRIFACEGTFIAVNSSLLGLVFTLIISTLINVSRLSYSAGILATPLPLRVSWVPESWGSISVLLMGLAFVTAWVASRKATSRVIADNLRHVT
jgi:putative ABC transport system permease protein